MEQLGQSPLLEKALVLVSEVAVDDLEDVVLE